MRYTMIIMALALLIGCGDTSSSGGGAATGGGTNGGASGDGGHGGTPSTGGEGGTPAVGGGGAGTGGTGAGGAPSCPESGSGSGADVDCVSLCQAVVEPDCGLSQDMCEAACTGILQSSCPTFDTFVDCGGDQATWACSDANASGVAPSTCGDEWTCVVDQCLAVQG